MEPTEIKSTDKKHNKQRPGSFLKLFSKKCSKSVKLCYASCKKSSHIQNKSKKLQQMLQLTHDYEQTKKENLEMSYELEDKTQLYKLLNLHYKDLSSYATTKELEVEKLEQEFKVWYTRAIKAEIILELKEKAASRALAESDELRLVNENLRKDLQEKRKEVETVYESYEAVVVELISQVQQVEILRNEFTDELIVAKSLTDEKEMTLSGLRLEMEALKCQNVELKSLAHQSELEKQKLENQVEQYKTHLVSLAEMKSSEVQQREELIAELMENLKMARSMFEEKNLAVGKLTLEVEELRFQNIELSKLAYQSELEKQKLNSLVLQLKSELATLPQIADSVELSLSKVRASMISPPCFEARPMIEMQVKKSCFLISNTLFEVDGKYIPIKLLGSGTYGVVCSFVDKETGEKVAIKKINDAFICQVAGLRTLREMRILRHLNHPNVITLKDVLLPADRPSFMETYLVYELMDGDLEKVLKSSMHFSADDCRHFLLEVLKGLNYLHNGNILHRDLKPANIFIDKNWNIKIGDFGLARTTASGTQGEDVDWYLTDYVVSRWYRAPEILLRCPYGKSSDMWSVGCIFAEILGRQHFLPGIDSQDQLDGILSIVGRQEEDELKFISSEECKQYVLDRSKDLASGVDLFQRFPNAERLTVDLLRRMLVFNPAERITVAEALHHPYFCDMYDPMVPLPELEPMDLEVEGVVDMSMLRDLVWEEMMHFKPYYSYIDMEHISQNSSLSLEEHAW